MVTTCAIFDQNKTIPFLSSPLNFMLVYSFNANRLKDMSGHVEIQMSE
jgi:hypothetical protein